jgi:hypothetical protein
MHDVFSKGLKMKNPELYSGFCFDFNGKVSVTLKVTLTLHFFLPLR